MGNEIIGLHQFYRFVFFSIVMGLVSVLHTKIDGIFCQLGMQLASVTCRIFAVVIVDAIRDIGGLLYFSNKAARTNSMNTTSRKKEYISFLHDIFFEGTREGVVFYFFNVFFRCYLLVESGIQES